MSLWPRVLLHVQGTARVPSCGCVLGSSLTMVWHAQQPWRQHNAETGGFYRCKFYQNERRSHIEYEKYSAEERKRLEVRAQRDRELASEYTRLHTRSSIKQRAYEAVIDRLHKVRALKAQAEGAHPSNASVRVRSRVLRRMGSNRRLRRATSPRHRRASTEPGGSLSLVAGTGNGSGSGSGSGAGIGAGSGAGGTRSGGVDVPECVACVGSTVQHAFRPAIVCRGVACSLVFVTPPPPPPPLCCVVCGCWVPPLAVSIRSLSHRPRVMNHVRLR